MRASALDAHGAMAALLRDALNPNLVQTLEHNPAFVHGGPFANIAHGCNSVMATRLALGSAEYVITEAGFGADLGAEKFFDIKCRKAGLAPDVVVLVATVRALKMHGGVARDAIGIEDAPAVKLGCANLARHAENLARFGVPVVVSLNRFSADTMAEIEAVIGECATLGIEAAVAEQWAHGGEGAEALAEAVARAAEHGASRFVTLYPDEMSLLDKVRTVARDIYRAEDIAADAKILAQLSDLEDAGFGHFPVCIAKTQYSFSTDPGLKGAPEGHIVPIREVRLAAGAEFVVVVCGDIMTMPGLPRRPAASDISVDGAGRIAGLF